MTEECKNIFWLSSYPKSGNTWLRAMLSAYINYGRVDINELIGSHGDTEGYPLQTVSHKDINELYFMERLLLRPAMLLHMAESSIFDPVIVKTHSINFPVEGIHPIPPALTRCAVTIARDPRDVVISYADHMGMSLDRAIDMMADDKTCLKDEDCKDVKTFLGSWSSHLESWMGDNAFPVSVITYEGMKERPGWALAKVLEKIGWDVEPHRVKLAVAACRFAKLKKQEQEKGFKEKSKKSEAFFRSGKAGGWRNILTADQAKRIEDRHHEGMKLLGYLKEQAA